MYVLLLVPLNKIRSGGFEEF